MRHIITLSTPISAASCGVGWLLLGTEHELFSVMAVLCVGNKACPPMHDVVYPPLSRYRLVHLLLETSRSVDCSAEC